KEVAQKLYSFYKTIETLTGKAPSLTQHVIEITGTDNAELGKVLLAEFDKLKRELDPYNWEAIIGWEDKVNKYKNQVYSFKVRDKEIKIQTHSESLSHLQIPKVALPKYEAWGDILRWVLQENVPGEFPFTAGLYPFKREGEDPTRL